MQSIQEIRQAFSNMYLNNNWKTDASVRKQFQTELEEMIKDLNVQLAEFDKLSDSCHEFARRMYFLDKQNAVVTIGQSSGVGNKLG